MFQNAEKPAKPPARLNRTLAAALLDHVKGNSVRTVLVEDAFRFTRELVTQELGILALIKRGRAFAF